MTRQKILIIAFNQPLDHDKQIRRRMLNAEKRAERLSPRFPELDLGEMQKEVHGNTKKTFLSLNGRYMDLLDLMNFVKNNRSIPEITPKNISDHYSLANTITLNGIYLYGYLKKAGYEPVLVQNYALADLKNLLQETPLAVCISSNFILMDDIKEIAAQLKQYAPGTTIIAGGMLVKKVLDKGAKLPPSALAHFSSYREKVDAFIIEAQGEQTLLKLLHNLKKGEDLNKVPNLGIFNEQGDIVFTPREKEHISMDETSISWNSIPKKYLRNTIPLTSSRGCFYRCRFCTYHWFFPEVLYKSIDVLRGELRLINDLGFVRHIRFTDDNFTANKARLKEVLKMIIDEKFNFTWSSFARAGALTPDLVKLMKASGCEFVDMGIESGSQAVLDNMDKRLSREQSLNAIQILSDHGIYSRGSFIVGFPGETEETFSHTIDLINKSGLPYYHPYLFYYSKNSLLGDENNQFSLTGTGLAWKHATMDSVKASLLMSQMTRKIGHGYTDGISYVEEIYKLLRGEGYSPEKVLGLFRLKRDLQLAVEESASNKNYSPRVDKALKGLETLVK